MARVIRGKNPRKPWTVRYRLEGREREKSFATSRAANEFRIKFEHDSRELTFIDPKLAGERFEPAAQRWISSRSAPRTRSVYQHVLDKHKGLLLARAR